MKKCSCCGLEKELSEFGKDSSRTDGLNVYCKACVRKKGKYYYGAYPEYRTTKRNKQREYNQKYMVGYRQRTKSYVDSQVKPCIKCGETREYVIDFHHIDPSKKSFTVRSGKRRSVESLAEELKKCICLCKNCHTEFHHLYGLTPEKPVEALTEYLGGNFNAI